MLVSIFHLFLTQMFIQSKSFNDVIVTSNNETSKYSYQDATCYWLTWKESWQMLECIQGDEEYDQP